MESSRAGLRSLLIFTSTPEAGRGVKLPFTGSSGFFFCPKTHRRVRLGNLREACLSQSPLFAVTVEHRRRPPREHACRFSRWGYGPDPPARPRGCSSAKPGRDRGMEPEWKLPSETGHEMEMTGIFHRVSDSSLSRTQGHIRGKILLPWDARVAQWLGICLQPGM